MGRAVVCGSRRFARLGSCSAVGEGHAVGGAIGLVVVAVLVVDDALLRLVALYLDSAIGTKAVLLARVKLQTY